MLSYLVAQHSCCASAGSFGVMTKNIYIEFAKSKWFAAFLNLAKKRRNFDNTICAVVTGYAFGFEVQTSLARQGWL